MAIEQELPHVLAETFRGGIREFCQAAKDKTPPFTEKGFIIFKFCWALVLSETFRGGIGEFCQAAETQCSI